MTALPDKVVDADEFVSRVESGASIFIGGFGGAGIPVRLLEALCHTTTVDRLTLINNNAGAGDPSFLRLVETGRVTRILCSYPRMPGSEVIRRQIEAGRLVVEVMPQGTLVERIRAAGAGLGPFFTPTGYGTLFAKGKETRLIDGHGYVLEMPLFADYAFIRAGVADRAGNLTYRFAQRNFGPVMCMAAKTTVVEVPTIVDVGELDPCQVVTPGIVVNHLVQV